MRSFLSLAAAGTLLATPALAQTAAQPCLTKGEFTALATYAMPSAIEGVTKRCAGTLGTDAYLAKNGNALTVRYAKDKNAAWPQAKAAFFKFSASKGDQTTNFMRQLPDESLRPIVDTVVEGMASQEIALKDCAAIDEFVRLLAPLPARNTAALLTLIIAFADEPDAGKLGGFTICKG